MCGSVARRFSDWRKQQHLRSVPASAQTGPVPPWTRSHNNGYNFLKKAGTTKGIRLVS